MPLKIEHNINNNLKESIRDSLMNKVMNNLERVAERLASDMKNTTNGKVDPKIVRHDEGKEIKIAVYTEEQIKIAKERQLFEMAWRKLPNLLD